MELTTPLKDIPELEIESIDYLEPNEPEIQTIGRIAVAVRCKAGGDCMLGCSSTSNCILGI